MADLGSNYQTYLLENIYKQMPTGVLPIALYYSLHSGDPGRTGANELAAVGSYARAQLNPDPDNLTNINYRAIAVEGGGSTRKVMKNALSITWPQATGIWNSGNPIAWFGVWNQSTGGVFLHRGQFTGTIPTISTGMQLVLAPDALQVFDD